MTTNHIDQLAQWYADAEQVTKTNLPNVGDVLIFPNSNSGGYTIEPNTGEWAPNIVAHHETARILSRAPKPKPAWHDAVAVMARCSNAPEGHREPFIRSEATHDVWAGEAGHARTGDLRDVTPLIEAKVTDEMVERLEGHFLNTANMALPEGLARRMLTAALGLETA